MFRRKKNEEEMQLEQKYLDALDQKHVALLTLDPRWHQLFSEQYKTKKLAHLEKNLNNLIKKQGQTNNDLKEYEKAKRILMENILLNMTDGQESDSPIRSLKQDKNQKLLDDLKKKTQEAEILQDILPDEIKLANNELLIESMRICYKTLIENTKKIEQEEEWIQKVRAELTEHILVKQEMEIRNTDTYRFIHDFLGADVIEIFDQDHKIWKGEIQKEKKVNTTK